MSTSVICKQTRPNLTCRAKCFKYKKSLTDLSIELSSDYNLKNSSARHCALARWLSLRRRHGTCSISRIRPSRGGRDGSSPTARSGSRRTSSISIATNLQCSSINSTRCTKKAKDSPRPFDRAASLPDRISVPGAVSRASAGAYPHAPRRLDRDRQRDNRLVQVEVVVIGETSALLFRYQERQRSPAGRTALTREERRCDTM
jgi:hypothetical protein